jgi:site-specific recombinase XerC
VIAAFGATALGTGLRLGELQALVWDSGGLHLERRRVVVKGTRDRSGAIVDTKSRRPREVPRLAPTWSPGSGSTV